MMKALLFLLCCWIAKSYSISNSIIDISNWQKDVNFGEVKRDGIIAVIHKATEGSTYTDAYYAKRRSEAAKEGILWGAYHFATGGNPTKQAEHFLNTVGNTAGVLLVLDLEANPSGRSMSPKEAEQFVKVVNQKTGRYPMIYGSPSYLKDFDLPNLNKCSLWVASWTGAGQPGLPPHRSSWALWQYTNGKVGGSPRTVQGVGACDRDRYNGSDQQLRRRECSKERLERCDNLTRRFGVE